MGSLALTTAKEFGAAIRAARRQQKLTQRQLALAAGTGERFIVELESGKPTIRLGPALAVADALRLKIAAQTAEDES